MQPDPMSGGLAALRFSVLVDLIDRLCPLARQISTPAS
jgi:hypothetical protein